MPSRNKTELRERPGTVRMTLDAIFSLPWTKLLLSNSAMSYLNLIARRPCLTLQSLLVLVRILH